nr:hypothetical protein Iba_chr12fCG10050 [Ipomoea batatas]
MENAHSGNSAGNSRRSLEDEDLLERSVKKSKRDAVDGLDEIMVQNPDDPLDIGGPTSPCDNQMIPTDRENIGDEVMLTKSREIIEDEVIMTAANHNLESSNPSANRGTIRVTFSEQVYKLDTTEATPKRTKHRAMSWVRSHDLVS